MVEPPAPGASPDALREALARWEQDVRAPFLARRSVRAVLTLQPAQALIQ